MRMSEGETGEVCLEERSLGDGFVGVLDKLEWWPERVWWGKEVGDAGLGVGGRGRG